MLIASVLLAGMMNAQTAADLDWVPKEKLDSERAEELLWFEDGAYVEPSPASIESVGTITAYADESVQVHGEYIDMRGNVVVERGRNIVNAPRLHYSESTELATIDGPLVIRHQGLVMTGASARANLFDGSGVITDADFLLHDFSLRGRAASAERLPNTRLVLEDAAMTRCEPGDNNWLLSSRRITLDPEQGRGEARDVVIRVEGVPLLYTPWLSFPLGDQRKSGFLTPSAGYDSDSGAEFTLPYYFDIAPRVDATWEVQSLWKRGVLHDGQLRFLLGQTANEVNAGYLADDDLYDPSDVIDERPGADAIEELDRWYLGLRHESDYGNRWRSEIDYNVVSDIDYLTDLDGRVGDSGSYSRTIGRSVTDRRAPALDRTGTLSWRGDRWRHTVLLQGFQVLDRDGREQYEKLPEVTSSFAEHLGPVSLDLELEYARFDKDTEGLSGPLAIVGSRTVVDAGLSARKSKPWGFIEPAIGVTWRGYHLDDVPAGVDHRPTSTIPRFSLDAGLVFDRFFEAGGETWLQTLEPRAYYLYVEDEIQDDLPLFDVNPASTGYASMFRQNRYPGRDRIGDANRLGIGLTTRLLARDAGAERLAFSIGQIVHFSDRVVQFREEAGEDPTRETSPLFAEVRIDLPGGLDISGTYEWEPDANRSNRGSFAIAYRSDDYRKIFNLRYVFASPLVERIDRFGSAEESDLSFIWPLGRRVSAIGRWNFGWDRNQTIESFLGIEYNNCCVKTRLVLRRFLEAPRDVTFLREDPVGGGTISETRTITPADTGIFVEFQFKGLATLGRRLDILLDRGIPGYREREDTIGQ